MPAKVFFYGLLGVWTLLPSAHGESRTPTYKQGRTLQWEVITAEGDQAQIRCTDSGT